MTNAFLTGERVILRSLETDDLDLFWAWFADREVVKYSLGTWVFPWSKSETATWLKRTLEEKETLSLGVVEKETKQLIGYAGITSISRINRSGEYYILLGEKRSWGKGYGTEVTQLIVHYGFASLNLHRIMLTVSSLNTGGVKAYKKAGFQQEGVLRQASYRDEAYHDKIVMAILRPEWEEQRSSL
jgi:RimJ/RimL family protein N-acetyltransferase